MRARVALTLSALILIGMLSGCVPVAPEPTPTAAPTATATSKPTPAPTTTAEPSSPDALPPLASLVISNTGLGTIMIGEPVVASPGREERTGDRFGLGRECERLG